MIRGKQGQLTPLQGNNAGAAVKAGLLDMVLCFSRALDLLHPAIADHHLRVAYLAASLAEEAGLASGEVQDILIAGALHDAGTVASKQTLAMLDLALMNYRLAEAPLDIHHHGHEGYLLTRNFPPFKRAAEAIRFHHVDWAHGAGSEHDGAPVPLASHILHLADRVAVLPGRSGNILAQADAIRATIASDAGRYFMPELVAAFEAMSARESFWFDLVCPHKEPVIRKRFGEGEVALDLDDLERLGQVFGRIIDYRSPFTAAHSSGVAATAEALGQRLGLSRADRQLLRVAGYLHDLGKLAVPLEIIEKPGRLTTEESLVVKQHAYHTYRILATVPGLETLNTWASLHHERLDGKGYPFRPRQIPLGARIVAVADVFTAITEDRPYRKGMNREQALAVLEQMVQEQALDGRVVAALRADFDEFLSIRHASQQSCRAWRSANR